jgi:hypothetical protein
LIFLFFEEGTHHILRSSVGPLVVTNSCYLYGTASKGAKIFGGRGG